MSVKYPKIKSDNKQRYYVVFYQNSKRYRLFNGKKINCNLYPNSYPISKRYERAQLLAAEVFKFMTSGLSVEEPIKAYNKSGAVYLSMALDAKLCGDYSDKYKEMLRFVYNGFVPYLQGENITSKDIKSYLSQYLSGVSYNTLKRHLNVLINEARSLGMSSNPMEGFKAKKQKRNCTNHIKR